MLHTEADATASKAASGTYHYPPAKDLLTSEQIAIVRERSDWKGVALALHAWAVIFGAMALFVWWPNPLTFILAVMLIGARQLGLAILMHDGAHGILCKSPKLNMFVSQWLCAYPMMAETNAYRRYHLKHHAATQQPDDPDLILSAPFPITKKSFRRKMVRDLTGQTGYQQRRAQIMNALGDPSWPLSKRLGNFARKLGRPLICQAVLFAVLALAGYWWLYPALWVLPFLTWHMAITRVRNIAEHAVIPDNNDPFRNARTTVTNALERAFVAPYWVNYHVEHHLLMWVPCYNLPTARRFLIANGFGRRMEAKHGYLEVLRLATSKPDMDDTRGTLVHKSRRERVSGTFGEGFKGATAIAPRPPEPVPEGAGAVPQLGEADPATFVRANTEVLSAPLVPEILLHVATELVPIWQMTEEELARTGLPPPFWAFAWAGGQALARYVLDHPEVVAGKQVLDFGAGSGLVGLAAAKAGAARVTCNDIDPFSLAAIGCNATANGASLTVDGDNRIGDMGTAWDVILVGDMCYEKPLSADIERWLRARVAGGTSVLIGDPGRTYLPKSGMEKLISYAVKTTRELEDTDVRNTSVWRMLAG